MERRRRPIVYQPSRPTTRSQSRAVNNLSGLRFICSEGGRNLLQGGIVQVKTEVDGDQIKQEAENSPTQDIKPDVDIAISYPPPSAEGSSGQLITAFANIKTELASIVSEDVNLHRDKCWYTYWAKQKAKLVTRDDIRNEIMSNFMIGRSWENQGDVAEANQKADEAVAENGLIMYYINGQRKMLDGFKHFGLGDCKCDRARIDSTDTSGVISKIEQNQ